MVIGMRIVNRKYYGLEINKFKTKWMVFHRKNHHIIDQKMKVEGKLTEKVDKHLYLGTTLYEKMNQSFEIKNKV